MIRIATRNSALAKAQAGQVAELLGGAELVECSSDGEPGDKARFVRGVERALLEGEAEIGVHSAKDVPAEMPEELVIAAVPTREDPADVWIAAGVLPGEVSEGALLDGVPGGLSLDGVPEGARVGTASLRRRAQLLATRPDLAVSELHGNVDTRLRKLAEGELDAIVLAAAGLQRLGREDEISFALPTEAMIPAAGQGALVLQARAGDQEAVAAATAIGDETALRELTAERAAVALLEATCATPIGVHARVRPIAAEGESGDGVDPHSDPKSRIGAERAGASHAKGRLHTGAKGRLHTGTEDKADTGCGSLVLEAFVGLPDGSEWIRDRVEGKASEPAAAGALLAERLLGAGAREILDRAERMA